MTNNKKIKIHVKNNHWAPGSFPTDAEGEKVFTITNSHFEKAFMKFPKIKEKVEIFIDWDKDNFNSSMSTSNIFDCLEFSNFKFKKNFSKFKMDSLYFRGYRTLASLRLDVRGINSN